MEVEKDKDQCLCSEPAGQQNWTQLFDLWKCERMNLNCLNPPDLWVFDTAATENYFITLNVIWD